MRDELVQFTPISEPELTDQIEVGPGIDIESWRLAVPAKPACYLLESGDGEPVLLATVANLRAALVRRLAGSEEDGASKRVDYRALVRRVRWRPVAGRFEANWAYMENARRLLPRRYKRLIRPWRAHWVGIDLDEPHPRFLHRDRPFGPPATCFGPLPTARAARRYIEVLEDLFDLCRYHDILTRAPHGEACSYKEMDRCPAPCDGSVSMDRYRDQLREAVDFIAGHREPWLGRTEERMRRAAKELAFERATRFKSKLERARLAEGREFRHIAPLAAFAWLSLQPGRRRKSVRVFAIGPGTIRLIDEFTPGGRGEPDREQLCQLAEEARRLRDAPVGRIGIPAAERIGLVAWHLLGGKREQGLFVPAAEAADPDALAAAAERFTARTMRSGEEPAARIHSVDSAEGSV